MSNPNPWSKFFWNDWENDPALRLCSLSAQGLWMRLLCIAAKSSPTGFVTVAGRPCSSTDIALLTGVSEQEVESLIGELSRNGVFSRDVQQRIYSRRMVRDHRKRMKLRQNGAKGGQSSYLNQKGIFAESEQPPDQGDEQGIEPQKPESRVHKKKTPVGPPVDPAEGSKKGEVNPLSANWSLPVEWRELAEERNWATTAIERQAVKFKNYFAFGRGKSTERSARGWKQTWLNWLRRELRLNPDAATFGKIDSAGKPARVVRLSDEARARLQCSHVFNDSFIHRWFEPCSINLEQGIIVSPNKFHSDYLASRYDTHISDLLGCDVTFVVRS